MRDYWRDVLPWLPQPVQECSCGEQKKLGRWKQHCAEGSGLSDEQLRKWTFATWIAQANTGCDTARQFAEQFAAGLLETPWLYLYGGVGLGKSHLLIAVTGALVEAGREVRHWSAPELYYQMLAWVKEDQYAEGVQALKQAAVLVLDDLGAERQTDFARDLMHSILDFRYQNGSPTCVASNLEPSGFPPRLASRLLDLSVVTVLPMDGVDMRQVER